MSGFTLLWQKMLFSSLWMKGTKEDKLVWVTLLMMKGQDGRVQSSVPGLARMAGVTDAECAACLRKFLNPDPDDTSKVEQGRKIREVPGGWEVVNHDLYRFSTEAKREFWRQHKAEQREKEKRRLSEAEQAREKRRKTWADKKAREAYQRADNGK